MFCKNCGNQLGPNSLFCTKCGTKAPAVPQAAPAQPTFTAPQPEIPAQPAFTAPQPEIPAQPAFTAPQPVVPQQPAFTTPQQPEIPAQPAFTAPQQPEIPAQPAFTAPQQPEIPAQPAFTAPQQPVYPQQPAFQQPPVYASPAVSAAPGGGNAANVRKIMYFITLIALCILTVGLFIGRVYRIEPSKKSTSSSAKSESFTIWEGYQNTYESLEYDGEDGILFLKAADKTLENIFQSLDYYSERSRTAYVVTLIFLLASMIMALLATLLVLVFAIMSIVSFASKKEPRAWSMLLVAQIFVLLAQLCALGYVISIKTAVESTYSSYRIHLILILSIAASIAFLVISAMFKSRAKQQRTPLPGNAYPAGGEYPMQ